jgi:hypothetical protein
MRVTGHHAQSGRRLACAAGGGRHTGGAINPKSRPARTLSRGPEPEEQSPVSHEFLSDAWWEAVHAIRDKYADQAPPVPYVVKINQTIKGAPFSDDEVKFHIDTSDGSMKMEPGHLDVADATVITDYATAKSIVVDQDQAAGMQAFMSGKIQVQGDMTKLMMMNAAPPDELAKQVAAEIKAVTA